MSQYKLTVHIHSNWVAQLAQDDYRLCLARGVKSGGRTYYNVVAKDFDLCMTTTIELQDNFAIAATRSRPADGTQIDLRTSPDAISRGQVYELDSSWSPSPANTSPEAPRDGFRFQNHTIASCVLFGEVEHERVAVYISGGGPLPPGSEDIVPQAKCKIWLSKDYSAGTIAPRNIDRAFEVDLSANPEAEVWFNQEGQWSTSR